MPETATAASPVGTPVTDVLAQAVTWHVEDRVIVEGPRTIVFA